MVERSGEAATEQWPEVSLPTWPAAARRRYRPDQGGRQRECGVALTNTYYWCA